MSNRNITYRRTQIRVSGSLGTPLRAKLGGGIMVFLRISAVLILGTQMTSLVIALFRDINAENEQGKKKTLTSL